MPVAVLDSCCCCIELRKGCLIYGYLELIGTIFYMISFTNLPKTASSFMEELSKNAGKTEDFREIEQVVTTVVRAAVIVAIIILFIKLIFIITLLIGLHKNKRGPVGAYLICTGIFVIISIIFSIVFYIKIANQERITIPPELWINDLVSLTVLFLFTIYFWMVIRSQYHKMTITTAQSVHYRA